MKSFYGIYKQLNGYTSQFIATSYDDAKCHLAGEYGCWFCRVTHSQYQAVECVYLETDKKDALILRLMRSAKKVYVIT